jgi:DNA (cytosine-5)-methyltransferase 1
VRSVDLFAGPGGWEIGAHPLGLSPLGIERDRHVCRTRHAAGLGTLRARVEALDPLDFAPVDLLIASPPCPTFSNAGRRSGIDDMSVIVECAREIGDGIDGRASLRTALSDRRSLLVVEPLRWALALRPTLIALEQVPPVLELWRFFADLLTLKAGYRTWSGILSAERYGVPQTRQRAFLLAALDRPVVPPPPTHTAYRPGEPARAEITIDGELAPWVSMADALGWGDAAVGFARRNDLADGGEYRARDLRSTSAPAQAVTEKGRSWLIHGNQPNATRRALDEPAATVAFGNAAADVAFVVSTGRDWKAGGDRSTSQSVDAASAPAPTVDGKGRWFADVRPATTVQGDPRIAPPGHHGGGNAGPNPPQMDGAIRVSLEDAAVLQGFPRDYPWRGTMTEKFRQVGNAVPPPLARAVLAALLDATP